MVHYPLEASGWRNLNYSEEAELGTTFRSYLL
jgi:hypothetical protein